VSQRSRMADGDTLTLHHIAAVRQDGQQEICDALVQQVDLVHVQHAAVRLREQPRLENRLALLLFGNSNVSRRAPGAERIPLC